MKYFEVEPARPGARCQREGCECGAAVVDVAESYLFVSHDCVQFRLDCPTLKQAQSKVRRMVNEAKLNAAGKYLVIFDDSIPAPLLYCGLAAESHGINLKIAAADAAHWRATGQAPYRPTPIGSDAEHDMSAHARNATGCVVLLALFPLVGIAVALAEKLVA